MTDREARFKLATMLKVLAISGSLRQGSSNTSILRAAAEVVPEAVRVTFYEGMGELPHFNPDLDGEEAAPAVANFRAQLKASDAIMICSPEYAHGVPGTLKNALDWIVGSGEFMGKPTALINANARSVHAQASLKETLTVMMAEVNAEASVTLNLSSNRVSAVDLLANPEVRETLQEAMEALAAVAWVKRD